VSKEFVEFTNNIIAKSNLEVAGGLATKYFEDYIVTGLGEKLFEFQEKTKTLYEDWSKRAGAFLSIADFFQKNGPSLFKTWLSEIFPFKKKYLIIESGKHSAVDSQISITYYFHEEETKAIKNSLFMNNLKEKTEKEAAIFLFTNAIKSISKYFTLLIDKEYKIFTSSLESMQIEDELITIEFKGAGRVK
jgi:hypothetical protein